MKLHEIWQAINLQVKEYIYNFLNIFLDLIIRSYHWTTIITDLVAKDIFYDLVSNNKFRTMNILRISELKLNYFVSLWYICQHKIQCLQQANNHQSDWKGNNLKYQRRRETVKGIYGWGFTFNFVQVTC
jgi:hypothetical protein